MNRSLVLFCCLLPCLSRAQDYVLSNTPDVLDGGKMATAPTIDGAVNADEWAGAATARRTLVVIGPNSPSGDRAQYWIGYDDRYVYLAVRTEIANGGKVQADEFRDNVGLGGDDSVTVLLDLNGNGQEFNVVSFNAGGATQLQLAGGRAAKREWGGAFESRGRITETGWEAEARIEWAVMPYNSAGPRDMKFLVDWYVSSSQRGVSTHSTQGDLNKIHVLRGVDAPAIVPVRDIKFLPYAYIGYNDETKQHIANAGLDVKTLINDRLNYVMTINPDFRNIENDILNLDFSNFERLPGESRPFFLEGNQFRLTGGINQRQLFASQRIDQFDTGINFYGTLSPNLQVSTLGIIDFDNEHAFVGTANYNLDTEKQFFTAFTALDRPGAENYGGMLEYFQRTGNYLLFGGYQQTDDEVDGIGNAFGIGYQYRGAGLQNVLIYEQVSPDFNPRIGFAPQRGFKGPTLNAQWTRVHPRGAIMETTATGTVLTQDLYDGGHYRDLGSTSFGVTFRNALRANVSYSQENFLGMINIFHSFSLQYPRNSGFRGWTLSHTRGNVAGAEYESTTARVFYRPIKRLQLDLRYQLVDHFEETDQTVFTLNWEVDKFQSFGGRLVGQDDEWNWFVSYKMSGNLGAEYFLILGDPNASSFQKTLVFKVSVPFTVR